MQPAPARKSEDRCKIRETVVWFAYITYATLCTRLAAASHTQPPCRKGLCRAQALYAERCSDCSTRERAIAERTRLTNPVLSSAATPGKKYTMAQHGCFPACTRCQRPAVLLDPALSHACRSAFTDMQAAAPCLVHPGQCSTSKVGSVLGFSAWHDCDQQSCQARSQVTCLTLGEAQGPGASGAGVASGAAAGDVRGTGPRGGPISTGWMRFLGLGELGGEVGPARHCPW